MAAAFAVLRGGEEAKLYRGLRELDVVLHERVGIVAVRMGGYVERRA